MDGQTDGWRYVFHRTQALWRRCPEEMRDKDNQQKKQSNKLMFNEKREREGMSKVKFAWVKQEVLQTINFTMVNQFI